MSGAARDRIAVIIGSGAMGLAAARRFGPACRLLVADKSEARLETALRSLTEDGHRVDAMTVDVRDGTSVAAVAAAAGTAGTVAAVIHTAGVSPTQASTRDIFAIDLVGTAHVIDRFLDAASPGTSLVRVASMTGHKKRLDPALESELATIPTDRLFDISLFDLGTPDTSFAYSVAQTCSSTAGPPPHADGRFARSRRLRGWHTKLREVSARPGRKPVRPRPAGPTARRSAAAAGAHAGRIWRRCCPGGTPLPCG
jgi:short chain dehydrogenase